MSEEPTEEAVTDQRWKYFGINKDSAAVLKLIKYV